MYTSGNSDGADRARHAPSACDEDNFDHQSARRLPRADPRDAGRLRGGTRFRSSRAARCGPLHARGTACSHGRGGWPGATFHAGAALDSRLVAALQVGAAGRSGPAGARQQSDARRPPRPACVRVRTTCARATACSFRRSGPKLGAARERTAPLQQGLQYASLGLQSDHPERHHRLRARRVRRRAPHGGGAARPRPTTSVTRPRRPT